MADVVVRCLAALVGSATLIGVAVAAGLLAARTELTGAVIHAVGITCVALTFATTAVLAAQVMPTRSGATGLTVAALGVGLTLRMIADGSHQLAWLAWTTPFGLTARAAPYADNRIVPLIVLGAFPIVLAGAALFAARHRDLGDGLWRCRIAVLQELDWCSRSAGSPFAAPRGPRSGGRRASPHAPFWSARCSPRFSSCSRRTRGSLNSPRPPGWAALTLVNVVAAALFSLLAVPTGLYAATRLAAMVADEKAGRWTLLFAQPISRVRLVSTEIMVTVGGVVALHCLAAVAIWSGAKITGAPLQLTDSLAGALNSLPVALLAAGAAAVGVGWLPSAALAIGALPVVGGFLVNVIMQSTNAPGWVVNLSPWTHLAAVPDTPPNWAATTIFLLIGAILTALGVYGYVQRDMAT